MTDVEIERIKIRHCLERGAYEMMKLAMISFNQLGVKPEQAVLEIDAAVGVAAGKLREQIVGQVDRMLDSTNITMQVGELLDDAVEEGQSARQVRAEATELLSKAAAEQY